MIVTELNAGPGLQIISNSTWNNTNVKGSLFWDGDKQEFVVFDGVTFSQWVPKKHSISLDAETQSVISWAREKIIEESRLKTMMESNESIRNAAETLKLLMALYK